MHRLLLSGALALTLAPLAAADDWPQWLGPKRDSIWRETGIVDKFPEGGLKERWRVKAGLGYAGPAVAGGRVYLMDRVLAEGAMNPNNPFSKPPVQGTERVLCLNVKSGEELWKHEYPCTYEVSYAYGPRCTPTVDGKRVYTLGAMGDLRCLDAEKGDLIWSKDFKKDYSAPVMTWGFASHPLVDGKKLICIVGGKGSVAVAFDKETGRELWKSLSVKKETGYSSPDIIEAAGKRQLLIWTGEAINSLDPETGTLYWSVPLDPNMGMAIATPRKAGDHVFVGAAFNKALLVKLASDKPAAEEVWHGSGDKGIGPVNSTPFIEGDYLYGVDNQGQLTCVKLATGERLWQMAEPVTGKDKTNSGTAFLVKNGERFFLFTETGDLVIAKLTPEKYEEVSRAKLLEPLTPAMGGRKVVWSHPAFADKCVFARNDKEIVCCSLAKE
jgi:outer membrane protein assembly factor BamB